MKLDEGTMALIYIVKHSIEDLSRALEALEDELNGLMNTKADSKRRKGFRRRPLRNKEAIRRKKSA